MAETITHNFVSAKTQSPDTTLVSKNEWNDGHVLSGGINGQLLTYDDTQPNNMRWINKLFASGTSASVVVSTPTPLSNLATASFTTEADAVLFISYTVFIYTSVGAAAAVIELYTDGVVRQAFSLPSGITQPAGSTFPLIVSAGAHTVYLRVTTAGNVNVLTFAANISIIGLGV